MNAVRKTVKLLAVCCLCAVGSPPDEPTKGDLGKDTNVTMEITKLDANDVTLTLNYHIRNGTDREAWVCSKSGRIPFEVFLLSDRKTLMIRKRLDVPSSTKWRRVPSGTYVRLVPGAFLAESVRIALPVSPAVEYATGYATVSAQPVRHLALEIGYYDEDLPALIHSIFAVADESCLTIADVPSNVLSTYFRGLLVRSALASVGEVNTDPYGQAYIRIPYSWQALTGEKILRVDVNDVSIPYKGYAEK